MFVVDTAIGLAVLLASVVLHECAHGVTAMWLGDSTAKDAGRITLDPRPHIDPVGSIILPLLLLVTTRSAFGYAKPVPVTPSRLRGSDRFGFAAVALAGPVSNVLIAIVVAAVAGLVYNISAIDLVGLGSRFELPIGLKILSLAFVLNVFLAAFNLIPVPPLDGSRLLRPFIGPKGRQTLDKIEPFGFIIILLSITILDEPFFQIVNFIAIAILRLIA